MSVIANPTPDITPVRATLREIVTYFLRLGFVAFGGPAAHIALMLDEVVERRKWVDRRYFMDMLAATQLVPGPNSTEMVIHIGHLHQGRRGLILAGLCFISPAFLLVLGISIFYGAYGGLPQVGALFYGIQPVVVAIVLLAVIKLAQTACRTPAMIALALAALALTLGGWLGTVWVILLGGLVGVAVTLGPTLPAKNAALLALGLPATIGQAVALAPSYRGLFWFFLQVGATSMGSGYVIASYLNNGLVQRFGWLTSSQLIDAIAVGQMTPGPVFTTAAFAGYQIMSQGGRFVTQGVIGATVSTFAIFLPSFFIVWIMAPWVPRLRKSRVAGAFLDGVNAAVVGSIAATTIFLLRAAVVDPAHPVAQLPLGPWRVDLPALLLFALSTWLLLRPRPLNSTWLIVGGATAGYLLSALPSLL